MGRSAKWGAAIAIAVALTALLYTYREPIVLNAVGFLVKQRVPVGPFRGNHLVHGNRYPGARPGTSGHPTSC